MTAHDYQSTYLAPGWYVLVDVIGERFYVGCYEDGEAARMVALEGGRMLRELGGVVCAVRRSALQLRGERVVSPVYAADALGYAAVCAAGVVGVAS